MHNHTKIVATISDKRCDVPFLQQLFDVGMDVVRMNSAHLNEEGFLKIINNVRAVSNRIALLIDTKGPEIRTSITENPIELHIGDQILVKGGIENLSSNKCIYVSYNNIVLDMKVGESILIDDGEVELKVIEVQPDHLLCIVQNEGVVGSRKSVNIPGVRINLPSLTEKDKKNILFAIDNNIDFIAHSFVR
ncbi:MAG: pyruvate kinase, partial [Dysgonamonadaceae bacterium]|nr:pyruvate kinase [Dysgonamonadaceae bacterium]